MGNTCRSTENEATTKWTYCVYFIGCWYVTQFSVCVYYLYKYAGQIGIWGYTAYAPTKYALRGVAEALQMEVDPYNIRVTVVYPPNTDTEGFKVRDLATLHLKTRLYRKN
jgi:NAD(P)-dependent dehydrogenase (short-subunit alcohol dehydrogenase family)